MQQKFDRSLGLFSAINMGVGAMIGSAIFVLVGLAFSVSGPGAIFSVFLAGIAATVTGFAFAELVTIIPKSGGGYVYVRDASNNGIVSFICGWGFWLGYGMSIGLFALGFGKFLNYFTPFIPQMVGAYLVVAYVLYTNMKGVKNSGKLQNYITIVMVVLLMAYIVYGVFFIEIEYYEPVFPFGLQGVFQSMPFLYITYIGYDLITTASEEIIEPEKNIPKAIFISLAIVTFLKTTVFFIAGGIIPWELLLPSVTDTPMVDTAVKVAGQLGGYLFALAGLFATLSSINTAVMASSRTSFALAVDKKMPAFFKFIHPHTKTPVVSIIAAGIIGFVSITVRDLQHISTVTSIFALTGYILVNLALMKFRKIMPHVNRRFKVPLYPVIPIVGILINIFLIVQLMFSNIIALTIAVVAFLIGGIYYYFALPALEKAPKGLSNLDIPYMQIEDKASENENERVTLVPVSNIETIDLLMDFATTITSDQRSEVVPFHVAQVSTTIPLDSNYTYFKESVEHYDRIIKRLEVYAKKIVAIKPIIIFSRDIVHAIVSHTKETKAEFLLLGWHPTGLATNMHNGIVHRILEVAPTTVGILKAINTQDIDRILFPYGGGSYAQATAKVVRRVAKAYGAEVTMVHIMNDYDEETYDKVKKEMDFAVKGLGSEVKTLIVKGELKEKVIELSNEYDLIVMGASLEWGLKEFITGSLTDEIMEKVNCSALLVRPYTSMLQNKKVRSILGKIKHKYHV